MKTLLAAEKSAIVCFAAAMEKEPFDPHPAWRALPGMVICFPKIPRPRCLLPRVPVDLLPFTNPTEKSGTTSI